MREQTLNIRTCDDYMPQPQTKQAFQKLGRYLIVGEIAKGGMATIYRAKLIGVEGFEKDVAIKKILPYWSDQQEFVDMLIDEAKILVRLQHNNIVQIFELAKEKDTYFIVMEFVKGFDLKKIISKLKKAQKPFPLNLACYIIKEICKGLDFAHSRKGSDSHPLNIVHRDISPQNIMVNTDGNVKITDFGIAKIMGRSTETAAGALKGKFSYMSPEQALGRDINSLTDIFALGALFYELVFLTKCFDGKNDLEIIEKVKDANIDLPAGCDPNLAGILLKAMSREADHRYQNTMLLRSDIRELEKTQRCHADQDDLKNFLAVLFEDEITLVEQQENEIEEKTKIFSDPQRASASVVTKINQNNASVGQDPSVGKSENSSLTIIEADTIVDSKILEYAALSRSVTPSAPVRPTVSDAVAKSPLPLIVQLHNPLDRVLVIKKTRSSLSGFAFLRKTGTLIGQHPFLSLGILGFCLLLSLLTFLSGNKSLQDTTPKPTAVSVPQTPELIRNRVDTLELFDTPRKELSPEEIAPKQTTTLMARVTITAEPPSSLIEITQGKQTLTFTGFASHEFAFLETDTPLSARVSHEGYATQEMILPVRKEQLIIKQEISLKPLSYGRVSVTARPWGTAKIDGQAHATPFVFTVPSGQHVVSVYFPAQKKTISQTTNVSPGKQTNCEASLRDMNSRIKCN